MVLTVQSVWQAIECAYVADIQEGGSKENSRLQLNLVPQRAHVSHVVDIHIIYSHLVPYEQTSILRGRQLGCRSISVSVILITQNHVPHNYWHHIHLLSPFLYHLLNSQHRNYVCLLWNPRPNSSSHEVSLTSLSGGNPRGSAPIRGPPLGVDVWCHTSPHALPWQHVCLWHSYK